MNLEPTVFTQQLSSDLPTLYEYYTAGGIQSGLNADSDHFTLNDKNITLYSGAMHYFRTPKQLWRNRLRKMRAAGLNAVETYIPWNLHEPKPGEFDFGTNGSDMQDFLDLEGFLKTAQEEDLLAIVRPGPYICAEWEFGGFPSWLLRQSGIKFRTSDEKYMTPVRRFFNALLPILAALQFINGGPIVMFQVENEYGSTKTSTFTPDKNYLRELREIYLDHNISSLLVTADGIVSSGTAGTLPEFLVTANFGGSPNSSFATLQEIQPNRPKMGMEVYPGWFDHWSETHQTTDLKSFVQNLELILKYPGSFNLYMFHGGTNFGLMNGANLNNGLTDNSGFQPDTTSYDYDAPLTEAGDYTEKYLALKLIMEKYATPKTKLPARPLLNPRIAYPTINITEYVSLKSVIDSQQVKLIYEYPIAMEQLDINNGTGQSYGYIVYRKENINIDAGSILKIADNVRDTVFVFVNGQLISPLLNSSNDLNNFGFWRLKNSEITLTDSAIENATIDLVVENWGRVGYGKLYQYYQFKGIWSGNILINDKIITNWTHVPLEFSQNWIRSITSWKLINDTEGPGFYKGYIDIESDILQDTYIDMRLWQKGCVIVNGFVLGRYATIGPQQCLYWPAPLMKKGRNEIIVFEHYAAVNTVAFSENQIWITK